MQLVLLQQGDLLAVDVLLSAEGVRAVAARARDPVPHRRKQLVVAVVGLG